MTKITNVITKSAEALLIYEELKQNIWKFLMEQLCL